MGKLKFVKKEYIKNFIENDYRNITKEWIVIFAVLNICVWGAAMYYFAHSLVIKCIGSVISLGVLISIIYFIRNVLYTKKNLYLYFGIYACLASISFSLMSYMFLENILIEYRIWISSILVFGSLFIAVFTFFKYIRNISRDYYKVYYPHPGKYALAAMAGVLFSQCLDHVDIYIIFGAIFGVVGVALASSVYFFIKYYCYCLLENENMLN